MPNCNSQTARISSFRPLLASGLVVALASGSGWASPLIVQDFNGLNPWSAARASASAPAVVTTDAPALPLLDLDGKPRPQGRTDDLGAYESKATDS